MGQDVPMDLRTDLRYDADPGTVEIGQAVVCCMDRIDGDLTLPAWSPAGREEQP